MTIGGWIPSGPDDKGRTSGTWDSGVPQFLDSTWEMLGGKPLDLAEQIRKGQEYMRRRYGHVIPPPEDETT